MVAVGDSRIMPIVSVLIAVCLVNVPSQAKYGDAGSAASADRVSRYVFVSDQSKLIQTGGIAGIHRIYIIKGDFDLCVDRNAGIASFIRVDANATDDSPFKHTLDPNEVFNMTGLTGTILADASVRFEGKARDQSSVVIELTFQDGRVSLAGQTTPPPGTADFFFYSLEAVAARKYGGGSGTPTDPYQIATAADLIALGETPGDYDKHFILTADIDLDPNLPGRKVFTKAVIAPDANDATWWFDGTFFAGVLDGNGHTIIHLTIRGGSCLGLFGQLGSGAQVKSLGVVDVNITGSGSSVGGLVGVNRATVTGCYSTGATSGSGGAVGGLVGSNEGIVSNSYSVASVKGEGMYGGGLVGLNSGTVANSYSRGSVSGQAYVGGLVGGNRHEAAVLNSYSRGSVSGDMGVGGLVGENVGMVSRCYSTGSVVGALVGGLIGGLEQWPPPTASVWYSFWDIQASGRAASVGGTGKKTTEMMSRPTFLNAHWDFVGETTYGTEDIWTICEGKDYPRFTTQFVAGDFNDDHKVDLRDLAVLSLRWRSADSSFLWCRGADLTRDGLVDFNDLVQLAANWLGAP